MDQELLGLLARLKYRRIQHDMNELIAAKAYAQKYGYSDGGVRYLLLTRRVPGYKIQSRWWVVDQPPLK